VSEKTVFVARERELAQLNSFMHRALAGEGQICFVTGDAGSGKTALITEFARRSLEQHPDLVVTFGQCNAHSGIGDPYLPFRETLQQLTGDVDEGLARGTVTTENAARLRNLLSLSGRALVEVGPDLIGLFLPPAGLLARLAAFALDESNLSTKLQQVLQRRREERPLAISAIDQSHIFEQYTNVIRQLAKNAPLMLVLDDLHWTDAATAALLFHLARRIEESRILIVGTFRPAEIALGRAGERHPMDKVLAECKRYHGNICIGLGETEEAERRHFVDALLDTEPNRLDEAFRDALFELTAGHPLFTIELLRDMQERKDLVKDAAGYWTEEPTIDWDKLPEEAEGVIAERMGRLPKELRDALVVASVQGETFAAEVIARVQETSVHQLVLQFGDELERQHRLVQGQGVRYLNGQRLSLYRFSHNLFQIYLYNDLTEAVCVLLHEAVGTVLEALYGDHSSEVAVQLALHFEIAGLEQKARLYLRLAGEQAAARFANSDAVSYFDRALRLTPPEVLDEQYSLLLACEKIYDLQGDRQAQRLALQALGEIVDLLGDDRRQAEIALRRANYAAATSNFAVACSEAQIAVEFAQEAADALSEAAGDLEWGAALIPLGDYDSARVHLYRAIDRAREANLSYVESESLRLLGIAAYDQGQWPVAQDCFERSLIIWRKIGDRKGEAAGLHNLGSVQYRLGNFASAREHYEHALEIRQKIGDRLGQAKTLTNLGVLASDLGDVPAAITYQEKALKIYQEIEDRRYESASLNNLGACYYYLGDYAKARIYFEQTLAIRRQIDDRRGEGEALLNVGAVCQTVGDYPAAEGYTREALTISQEVGDRPTEGVVLTDLGTCRWAQGDYAAARDWYAKALQVFEEIHQPHEQVSPLRHLGKVYDCLGEFAHAQGYLDQALHLSEQHTARHKQHVLLSLSLLSYHLGDPEAALAYSEQALSICREGGYRSTESHAWMCRGTALIAAERLTESAKAYQRALQISRELRLHNRTLESLAGLAHVAMMRDDLARAVEHVEEILRLLETRTVDGTDEPLRIYLICYHVLRASQDSRAQQIVDTAYHLLNKRVAMIEDETLRRSFLENVEVNREIVQEWQA
jgi:predicted ATPase/Flp pilus assembly protein TadD